MKKTKLFKNLLIFIILLLSLSNQVNAHESNNGKAKSDSILINYLKENF